MTSAVPVLGDQLLEQLEDLRLDGHVERGGRLVGDQQPRLAGQRHRDQRPLPHAAGELVRVLLQPPVRVGDADLRRAGRAASVVGLLAVDVLGAARSTSVTWMPIGTTGFSERQRVLEDHRDVAAAQSRISSWRQRRAGRCPRRATSP